MNPLPRYVRVLARVLVAIIFLLNGLGIVSQAGAAKQLLQHGASARLAPFLMACARALAVVAGFCLTFGIYPRLAAVALLVFLLSTTFLARAFWQVVGRAAFAPELINFLKNTCMIGGLRLIAATESQPILLPRTPQ
jgi:putative oxidoreductase